MHFWNNFHQVRSEPNNLKILGAGKLNMIAKIG